MGLPKKDESEKIPGMTKEYQGEEKTQQAVDNMKAQQELNKGVVIFWGRCSAHQIGNWIPEIKGRESGTIIKREQPLRFDNHIKATDNEKMIKFIRDSQGFVAGDVIECKNMEEAQSLTLKQNIRKQRKHQIGQDIESTQVEMVG